MKTNKFAFALYAWVLAHSARASVINYKYDPAGRLLNASYNGNTNSVFSYDNNGNLMNQSAFASLNADLGITQVAAPSPVAAGVSLHYTVTVFNNSTNSVSAGVTDALPPNAAYLSSAATQGSVVHSANNLTWTVGTMTNGAIAMMNFSVRAAAAGSLTNTTTVSASPSDPDAGDNTSVLVTAVVAPPTLLHSIGGGLFTLSWPVAGSEGFSLEYAPSLTPPVNWQPVPATPLISGGQYYFQDSLISSNRFYRLISPP
jgi:uncharacterized repeat protein (TIGR01451 family)